MAASALREAASRCHEHPVLPILDDACHPHPGANCGHPAHARQMQGDWTPMTRTYGASWDASELPSLPLDVKLTQGSETIIAT